jgi:hypothetical protein
MHAKIATMRWKHAVSAVLCAAAVQVSAGVIVSYNLDDNYTPTEKDPNVTAQNIGKPASTNWIRKSGMFEVSGAANVPMDSPDLDQYARITLTPAAGYVISYGAVKVDFGGDNNASATDYTIYIQLRSSRDDYASVIGSDSITLLATTGNNQFKTATFDLSTNPALQNLENMTEFRFYVYDSTNAGTSSTFRCRLDNFVVEGAAVIPEPATLSLFLISAAGLLLVRRASRC